MSPHVIELRQPDIHDYIQTHIPSAVYMSEKTLRVTLYGTPGKWIPPEAVQALFRRLGLDPEMPVVIYTGKGLFKDWGDGLEQTMVVYSPVRFGHNKVYVLDGGLDKWLKEGRPTSQVFLFKHLLGYSKVKLYEGSFTEWSSYPANPIVTGRSPGSGGRTHPRA